MQVLHYITQSTNLQSDALKKLQRNKTSSNLGQNVGQQFAG